MEQVSSKKVRYHLLDEYRGFVVTNMIIFHALWDLVYMYGWDVQWFKDTPAAIWQVWGCSSFIFLSGFCWQLGRKPAKRGLLVFVCGFVITVVTLLVMPNARVIFGVLTFHGSAMLIVAALSKLLEKIPAEIGALASVFLFLVSFPVNDGYLGFGVYELLQLPESWYANLFTTYLGLPERGFWSTDYFSIFPWIFLYIAGYFVYTILKKKEMLNWAKKSICPFFGLLGKHSLIIYMLHQPVIYGVCEALHYIGLI